MLCNTMFNEHTYVIVLNIYIYLFIYTHIIAYIHPQGKRDHGARAAMPIVAPHLIPPDIYPI